MKVSQLIKLLQENNKPDDEIIVLWWEKDNSLTDEAWDKISTEFDSWDGAGNDISEWIADAVIEHAELNGENQ